ncbi:MAG: B12-binding domain-containing radical SAM protein [Synergistaceae bacterium]|nr:B12-binding domain-containing radical SAM protein [Synergistaceae bacterium]
MLFQSPAILTAILKPVCDFSLLDANGQDMSDEAMKRALIDLAPAVVLITALTVESQAQAHHCAKLAKEALPESTVVMGGGYPTLCDTECIEDTNVDYIFLGHAEERADAFVTALLDGDDVRSMDGVGYRDGNGVRINPLKTYLHDVKKLVDPDYSLWDLRPYIETPVVKGTFLPFPEYSDTRVMTISTSYGCPYNCNFCASRILCGGHIVFRPLDSVIREIEYFIEKYGVRGLETYDDNILFDRARFKKLFTTLESRGHQMTWWLQNSSVPFMDDDIIEFAKAHGCCHVTLPVESGCERTLRDIIGKPYHDLNKVLHIVSKCHEVGLEVTGAFIIGFPGETWDEIRSSLAFAEKCGFDNLQINIAQVYPKTRLYDTAVEMGLLPNGFRFRDFEYVGFGAAMLETDQFAKTELEILRAFEWDRINFSTPEKKAKVASYHGLTPDEMDDYRRKARRSLGLFQVKDRG